MGSQTQRKIAHQWKTNITQFLGAKKLNYIKKAPFYLGGVS